MAAALGTSAWALAGAPAHAHPHGSLDCQVRIQLQDQRLVAIELQLTMDPASTAQWLPRLHLEQHDIASTAAKQGLMQQQLLAGLLRHSGWMLQVRPDALPAGFAPANTIAGPPDATTSPVALNDPDAPSLRVDDQGRLTIQVRLVPPGAAPLQAVAGWHVSCRDPRAYWLAGFERAEQVSPSGHRCEVSLGELQDMAQIALVLQAAARQASAAGSDRIAPQLVGTTGRLRTSYAHLRC